MVEVSEHIDKSVIMTQQVGDFNLHVVYTSKRKFEITVTKMSTGEFKTSVIDAVYEPIFGADAEEISMNEIPELYDMWLKDPSWGSAVWCIKKCNYMPQKPVYDRIQRGGIWNLDEMGLRPNSSWSK